MDSYDAVTAAAYARELTNQLYDACGIEKYAPTVFRNRKSGSVCRRTVSGPQIILSWPQLKKAWVGALRLMRCEKYVWRCWDEGLAGVHQLVLHEFAHVLQGQIEGGRTYGSVHNTYYVSCLMELVRKFGYKQIGRIIIEDM